MKYRPSARGVFFSFVYWLLLLTIFAFAQASQGHQQGDEAVVSLFEEPAGMTSQQFRGGSQLPQAFERAFRNRGVYINPLVKEPSNIRTGHWIQIDLFDGISSIARVGRVSTDINGVMTIRARLADSSWGYVLLSIDGDKVLGTLRSDSYPNEYYINPDRDSAGHQLIEIAHHNLDFLPCGTCESNHQVIMPEYHAGYEDTDSGFMAHAQQIADYVGDYEQDDLALASTASDGRATINVMVVYTQDAYDWASGHGGINNVINQAMERGQTTIDNSELELNLNLVHSAYVDYTEKSSAGEDLGNLQSRNSGHMDIIHEWRDEHGADLVTLLAYRNDVGGLAYLLGNPSGSPDWAFSVVRVQQASGYTTIHELGHNMGCHHSRWQNSAPAPASGGLFTYSTGWRWVGSTGQGWVSVMTYGDGYQSAPLFSNPEVLWEGTPTGSYEGQYAPADNTRSIREVKHVLANYRPPISAAAPRMTGHWTLNEQTGLVAHDSSGNEIHADFVNGSSSDWLAGVKGNALFLGGSSYLQLPEGFDEFDNGFSVALWAYPQDAGDWARFVDLGNGSQADNIIFSRHGSSNDLTLRVWQGSTLGDHVIAHDAIDLYTWQFFVGTIDAQGNARIYKDGQLVAEGTTLPPRSVPRSSNLIGASNWQANQNYSGMLDDVRIYNYPLSESRVQNLYQKTRRLSHHWKLDDSEQWQSDGSVVRSALVDYANDQTASWIVTRNHYIDMDAVWFNEPPAMDAGYSIGFMGTQDHAELGMVAPGGDDFTIKLWFNMDDFRTNPTTIVGAEFDQPGNWSLNLWGDNDYLMTTSGRPMLRFSQHGLDDIMLAGAIDEHRWYHIKLTRNSHSLFNVYLDGQLVHSGINAGKLANGPQDGVRLAAGRDDETSFRGWIDDVKIYNYAVDDIADLTGDERVDHHDLALIAEYWLASDCQSCQGADLNRDGRVDFADLAYFAGYWLTSRN